MIGNRLRHGFTAVAVVTAGLSIPAVAAPAAAVERAPDPCKWAPDVLPIPENTFHGRVTAGAGEWLAGMAGADGPNEAIRWRNGKADPLGPAFGLDTTVTAVNKDGVVVGTVTTPDGTQHAFRHHNGRFERLPESATTSTALDINEQGDIVGQDNGRLAVWPAAGRPRFLDTPAKEAPYGRAAIDDDGTVVARTGEVTAGALQWRTYAWKPDGTRVPLPTGDVQDVSGGEVVGATGNPDGVTTAASWHTTGMPRPYVGGSTVVALNDEGVTVGTGKNAEPLLWDGLLPSPLPTPRGHTQGAVTALNADEAGGFAYPTDDDGAVPVRWRCR